MAVVTAYDGLARNWERGAGHVYRPLARALVAQSPVDLEECLVLDVGCGTGAVTDAAIASGARVVAADRAASMVAYQGGRRCPAAAADALALPFGAGAFDVALAGFLLNQVAPVPALAELARTVRAGGVVLASTWSAEKPDPVKVCIDAVLASRGWAPPTWYHEMKTEVEPISGNAGRLVRAAQEVGLVEARASVSGEGLCLRDPATVVAYRLSMPHIAPWVSALDPAARAELTRSARAAAATYDGGWRPAVIFLACRVPPHPSRRATVRPRARW